MALSPTVSFTIVQPCVPLLPRDKYKHELARALKNKKCEEVDDFDFRSRFSLGVASPTPALQRAMDELGDGVILNPTPTNESNCLFETLRGLASPGESHLLEDAAEDVDEAVLPGEPEAPVGQQLEVRERREVGADPLHTRVQVAAAALCHSMECS